MDTRAALVKKEPGRRRELASLSRRDGLIVAGERFPVREHGAGGLGRPVRMDRGRFPRLGLPVVMGEPGSQLAEALGVQALERLARPAMELAAARGEQRGLGDLLRERVLEGVDDLLARRALEEELQARELAEMGLDRARAVPDRGEKGRGELPAQDRRGLKDALGLLVEPVDARGEHAMHRVRDRKVRHETLIANRAGQLFQEERIAFGLVEDELGDRVRGGPGRQQRLDDRAAGLRGEPPERQLGGERALAPRRAVAGTIAGHQQDGRPDQAFGQEREVFLRRPVRPVEVLDLQDERPRAALAHAHLAQRVERPGLEHVGGQAFQRSVRRAGAEERQQVGRARVGVHPELAERRAHLLGDRLGGVRLAEPAPGTQEVRDRDVGDGRAVGQTPALEIGHAAVGEAVPELEQEPRLPDPGLADDPHGLAPAFLDGGEEVEQGLELPVAPDEAAQALRALALERRAA